MGIWYYPQEYCAKKQLLAWFLFDYLKIKIKKKMQELTEDVLTLTT